MHSCVLCVFATFVHINVTCVRFMFVDVTISLFSLDFQIFRKGCSAHFKRECVDRLEISDEMFLVHVLLSVLVFRGGGFYIVYNFTVFCILCFTEQNKDSDYFTEARLEVIVNTLWIRRKWAFLISSH